MSPLPSHVDDVVSLLQRHDYFADRRLATSVSIGIACYPEDGATLDALAAHADGALYAAKQDGRNRSVKFRAAA